MKIKPELVDRLADQLWRAYRAKELIVLKADEAKIRAKISEIVTRNFQEEEAIEEEARRTLASHAAEVKQAGEADPYKMFLLIKQKLAQKRGFVL
jgi:hypothetical protein